MSDPLLEIASGPKNVGDCFLIQNESEIDGSEVSSQWQ